jgi:hypothetical protein
MKKTNTHSKLKAYSAAAGSLVLSGVASAQNLQYTDVNPDVILDKNSGPFEMDFNNDLGPDMTFQVAFATGSGSSTYNGIPFTYVYNGSQVSATPGPLGGVQGQVIGSSSTFGVTALNYGDAIAAANNFSSQQAALGVQGTVSVPAFNFNYDFNQGEFLGVSQKFLGMKFSAGSGVHYGWVRLSLDTLDPAGLKLTIHDYAYNGDADQPINAGDPSALIIAQAALEDKVSISPLLDGVAVNVTPDLLGSELVLSDMSGKEVNSIAINDIGTVLGYADLKTGIYFATLKSEQGSVSKKVYVK